MHRLGTNSTSRKVLTHVEYRAVSGVWQMGDQEYKWKGPFLGRFVWLLIPVLEVFVLLWLLLSAQYKIFCSSLYIVHYFNSFVNIAQQTGQAVVQGRLSPNVCPHRKIVRLKSIHFLLIDVAHSTYLSKWILLRNLCWSTDHSLLGYTSSTNYIPLLIFSFLFLFFYTVFYSV